MDSNNLMPSLPNGEPVVNTGDWRSKLPPGIRQKIINRIVEILKKYIPFNRPDGINELTRAVTRFEEIVFGSAINQNDYRQKISMKMLTIKSESQNGAGSSSSISAGDDSTSMDSCISQFQRVTLGE